MILEVRAAPPFYKNGFLVVCERTREAAIVDPGDEVDELLAAVRDYDADVRCILLTHAHVDHVTGVAAAKAAFDVPIHLHRDDLFLYERAVEQGASHRRPRSARPSHPGPLPRGGVPADRKEE
jgi:glyoxylase-like metal-dependent hydrolase (beta-lactamase superfamily II)